jgi:hypothetical protein
LATESRHFFHKLRAEPLGIATSREILEVIGQGPDDGKLGPELDELEPRSEQAVVVGLQDGQRGRVREHHDAA